MTIAQRNALTSFSSDNGWFAAMKRGDFEGAWRISDAVLAARVTSGETCWHLPRDQQFVWRGESLVGKRVLIRCYHGLGDTLQFIRLAAPLRQIARHVTVWAQPALLGVLSGVEGVDALLPLDDGAPHADYDIDIEVMELAHALRITSETIPAKEPYIHVPHRPSPAWRKSGQLVMGLVWQAGDWDPRRSLPARFVRDLVQLAGVQFVSFQRGESAREAAELGLMDVSTDDVGEAAARMTACDLIISVDSMTAHLAGAIGAPVWTLLHTDCDWRWMAAGSTTPWYPTMRLFRQVRANDWSALVSHVGSELARLTEPEGTNKFPPRSLLR